MVRALKTRGLDDVQSLQRRAARLLALRRIGKDDYEYISLRLNEIEARIIEMREANVDEEAPF